jgi:hypothetical protein
MKSPLPAPAMLANIAMFATIMFITFITFTTFNTFTPPWRSRDEKAVNRGCEASGR